MTKVGAIDLNRPDKGGRAHKAGDLVNRSYLASIFIALAVWSLTSCVTTSSHQFATVTNWRTRTGQLLYRTPATTLIGDVIVRTSPDGEFELTLSKGPGVSLLVIRQDSTFAEVKGALARAGWSGPVESAPQQLRGWLGLREKVIHSNERSIRHAAGGETFLLHF